MVLAGNVVAGDAKFMNADGSKQTEICIAAANSKASLAAAAKKYNYSSTDLSKFSCNGLSLNKFAKKYNKIAIAALNKPLRVFSFDNHTGNIEADICIAAARSNDSFEMIKQSLAKPRAFYKTISCNNMPLEQFARKFGNKNFKM